MNANMLEARRQPPQLIKHARIACGWYFHENIIFPIILSHIPLATTQYTRPRQSAKMDYIYMLNGHHTLNLHTGSGNMHLCMAPINPSTSISSNRTETKQLHHFISIGINYLFFNKMNSNIRDITRNKYCSALPFPTTTLPSAVQTTS